MKIQPSYGKIEVFRQKKPKQNSDIEIYILK